ncbi:nuclear transport factor 2 family protein [Ramlibacter sp. AN1133]|uniref:nuclear transport factor 2 family protein n=1 Tax=Ramlibacter sp. AN1133 TaxID=3133429 RepID=UPI0030C463B9
MILPCSRPKCATVNPSDVRPTRKRHEGTNRAYAAAWAARGREAWLATFAAEARQQDPVGGPVRQGHEQIGEFWDREMARYLSIRIEPREIYVIGKHPVMVWTIRGVTAGGPIVFSGVDVFEFDLSGLIHSVRAFWNSDAVQVSSSVAGRRTSGGSRGSPVEGQLPAEAV